MNVSDLEDDGNQWKVILDTMGPWARSLIMKAFFLRGYEGAFTAADYDCMEGDERDFLMQYLSEIKIHERDEIEKVKADAKTKSQR